MGAPTKTEAGRMLAAHGITLTHIASLTGKGLSSVSAVILGLRGNRAQIVETAAALLPPEEREDFCALVADNREHYLLTTRPGSTRHIRLPASIAEALEERAGQVGLRPGELAATAIDLYLRHGRRQDRWGVNREEANA